jgi:AraC family ethanolamine operon transcriptional activator
VSLLDQLADSSALKINRFPDFDHFTAIGQLGDARSIPLELRGFAASFAILRLKSCSIFLQQTFPRILQQTYSTEGAIIAFGMDDTISAMIDGAAMRFPTLLLTRGRVPAEIVEPRTNLAAFIAFDAIDARDWPGVADRLQLITTRPAEYAALQDLVREMLMLASQSPESLALPHMIDNLEESLLRAVDRALHAAPPYESKRANLAHYLALVRKLDELLAFDASRTLYSADVARQLGISVRTLHNAVVAIRGMIKAVALANGFWHMGEFGALYRNTFGETPQQTLADARSRRR